MAEPATSKAVTSPIARPVQVPRGGADQANVKTGPVAAVKADSRRASKGSSKRRAVRLRQVNRIVRRVDTWSVFKMAVLFFLTCYLVLLFAGVLLWGAFVSTGTLDKVENFIRKTFALDTFHFNGSQLFQGSLVLGAVLVVAGSAMVVAMSVFFNIFSELTGGVRVTVLEEETQLVSGTD
ncbi:MAG: hypothetical protein JWL70_1911 [Acidimicrobiia bacterium]|nr:hypothetical protein [Acidimicrobiia bacterium]